jgi:hypothetical protein
VPFIIIFRAVLIFLIASIVLLFIYFDDTTLDFEKIYLAHSSESSETINIVHLSDMHFPDTNVNLEKLITGIKAEQPDIIAITGDIVNTRTKIDTSGLCDFMGKLAPIAPIFYVDGNHDIANKGTALLHDILQNHGVTILKNQTAALSIKGKDILIIGNASNVNAQEFQNHYVILLSHVPSFNIHSTITPDLILAGHVHGGHARIFGKALLCPDTLLFPKYSNGLYTNGQTNMIVSRGVGSYLAIPRFNNKPHVPIIKVAV